jgi:hypothetical protein
VSEEQNGILKTTVFTHALIRENGLDLSGFEGWVFWESMLFKSSRKWWGDRGERDRRHEGLDLVLYQDRSGRILRLELKTRIPAMYDGVVAGIIDDFLGKSVIVAHQFPNCDQMLLSIYGHTSPGAGLKTGETLKEGEIIGTLAGPGKSKAAVRPHLHVSLGWVSSIHACRDLDWGKMNDPTVITMLDPLSVLDGRHQVLPPDDEKVPPYAFSASLRR